MITLIPIITFSLVLAYISGRNSSYDIDEYGGKAYLYKERFVYMLMALGMAFFVGLRTRGNDTYTYRLMYEGLTNNIKSFSDINWLKISDAPGLQFVSLVLHNIGATTQDFFMVFALFTISIYLWFVRKYTSDIFLSVYYFITMGVYTFAMAAIKQTTAVAFLLIATDCAIQKKWKRFLIWVCIAELFHPYSFVYLIIPLLFFSPWTQKTYWLLGGTIFVSLFLSEFMSGIFAMTENLGYSYEEGSFSGDGVNIFRVLVVWVPVVISLLARKFLCNSEDREKNLIINLTMVNAMIMFIGLFGTANYFARLANYFLIFQALSLPWLFRFFNDASKRLVITLSIICYAAYFYYQMVIAQGKFDDAYTFISIFEYIKQLL